MRRGYLVVRRIAGARNIDQAVLVANPPERDRLLASAGRLLATIHLAGFSHRDFKAGNVVADPEGKLWIVDFDGIKPATHVSPARRAAELERLVRDLRVRGGVDSDGVQAVSRAYLEELDRKGLGKGEVQATRVACAHQLGTGNGA